MKIPNSKFPTCRQAGKLQNSRRGYTLLFSVLIISLMLSIGISVFNISLKEFRLSVAGRESQFAFFAADSGAECALFWDFQESAFSTSSPAATIDCFGGPPIVVTSTQIPANPPAGTGVFTREFKVDLAPECVTVIVTKWYPTYGNIRTELESFGQNTCDLSAPQRVERALRVRY